VLRASEREKELGQLSKWAAAKKRTSSWLLRLGLVSEGEAGPRLGQKHREGEVRPSWALLGARPREGERASLRAGTREERVFHFLFFSFQFKTIFKSC
jgi:hypothetical protein